MRSVNSVYLAMAASSSTWASFSVADSTSLYARARLVTTATCWSRTKRAASSGDGGAAGAVERHRPNWEAAFDGLTFISPADDPLPGSLPIGQSCRNGQGAIERLLFAVCMASRFPLACVMEYDCLIFSNYRRCDGSAEERPTLWCSETFPNEDPVEIYAGPVYGHAPWIATGETWWKLLCAGSDSQHGFPDRWLANAALRAKVELRGMEGAYSRDQGFDAQEARLRRLAGAPCLHGVKTREQFETIMREQ